VVGMFNRTVNGMSALISLLIGLGLMVLGTFFTGAQEATESAPAVSGWLSDFFASGIDGKGAGFHYMGAVFAFLVVLQLVLGATGARRETPYVQVDAKAVDLTPWRPAPYVGGLLAVFGTAIYIYFMN